jgi:predicted metal-dependent HD superfamily phosphohydrolase
MSTLKDHWLSLAARYSSNTQLAEELWTEIYAAYTEPSRHYHTLSHIEYLFDHYLAYRGRLDDPDAVFFSVIYHDVVYEPTGRQNEEKSADFATRRMELLGVALERIKKARQQILATKRHERSEDADTNYLLDFDLAILGESPERYQQYISMIRCEYASYPPGVYNPGRRKVIEKLLAMKTLFKTEDFIRKYEQQARRNMEAELAQLY